MLVGRSKSVVARAANALVFAILLPVAAAEPTQPAYPVAVAVTGDGAVYVADLLLPGVWVFREQRWTVLARGGRERSAPLRAPRCLVVESDGQLLVGDSSGRDLYRLNPREPAQPPQPLTGGKLGVPIALVVHPSRGILVSDLELQGLYVVAADGPKRLVDLPFGTRGLALDGAGELVAAMATRRILYPEDSLFGHRELDAATDPKCPAQFPQQLASDADEATLYLADSHGRTIWRIGASAKAEAWLQGEPLQHPVGLCWHGDRLYIADPRARAVLVADRTGKLSRLGAAQAD